MTTNFRAQSAELLAAIQLYTGLNPAASEMSSVEKTEKLMDAMAATVAALATPPHPTATKSPMTDHFVEVPKKVLSPAAEAVFFAADGMQPRQYPQPVPVSERLPEPSVKVLAYYFNSHGKGRTICAIWVPAKSRSDKGDLDADDFLEYDDESDKYHWPEGWYEAIENWEELGWAKVYEGEIAYWQPLPKWPAYALPTPEATNA